MQREKCFPIIPIERVSDAESATGQKNYALAWKRAKQLQFNSQLTVEASSIAQVSADVLGADKVLLKKRILYQRKI